MPKAKYQGAEAIPKLLREYAELRGATQIGISRELERRWPGQGRSQQIVNGLFSGKDHTRKDPPAPYFGLRPHRTGDLPLLYMVAEVLQIPRQRLDDAVDDDRLAWAAEQARRRRVELRTKTREIEVARQARNKAPAEPVEVAMVTEEDERLERATWVSRLRRKKVSGGGVMGERGGGTAKRAQTGASVVRAYHQRGYARTAGTGRTERKSSALLEAVPPPARRGA